jgi:hypothetical protein
MHCDAMMDCKQTFRCVLILTGWFALTGCAQKTLQNMGNATLSPLSKQTDYLLGDAHLAIHITTNIDPTSARFDKWGQRFDRSAVVTQITFANHQMVNQLGLPDEFGQLGVGAIGFDDAVAGEQFIKPGVGVLIKPDHNAYRSSNEYDFALSISTEIKHTGNQLFVQQVSPVVRGYAYRLVKTYDVNTDENTLIITYSLTNAGSRRFDLEHYNHNFLTLDNKPFGEQYHITLGKAVESLPHSWMHMQGNRLVIDGEPGAVGFVQVNEKYTAKQADLSIFSTDGKLGIELTGDQPAYRFAHFFTANSYSPERFTRVWLEPQQQFSWQARYHFVEHE